MYHIRSCKYIEYAVTMCCFNSAGVFPSAWYGSVREIAARSPLLLSMGGEKFLDKELEINHPLKIENIATVRVTRTASLPFIHCSVDRFGRVTCTL